MDRLCFHYSLNNQIYQYTFLFISKPKNLYPNMKFSVFKNSKIEITIPTALNSESKFENPLVFYGFRHVVTSGIEIIYVILDVFNYFQM